MNERLQSILQNELAKIPDMAADEGLLVQIPKIDTVDQHIEDVASLVAKTSNVYGRLSRLAGMARANAKLAKGKYEFTFKSARGEGKNQQEGTASAMAAASDAHDALLEAEALVQLIEGLENASRVASESARKIFDKVEAMWKAEARENRGQPSDRDYNRGW